MSRSAQRKIGKTKNIKHPNKYVQSLYKDLKDWVFDEEMATQWKGEWRQSVFQSDSSTPLHLEIGTGKGKHFSELCFNNPTELFLGIELKYKPISQTVQSVKNLNCKNAKILRYNAGMLDNVFEKEELDNVYIYFPDPWPKTKYRKHRLLTKEFAKTIFNLQKNKSLLNLRMDSLDYFLKSVGIFKSSGYKMINYTEDLYKDSESNDQNLINQMTQFEAIFFRKKVPIKHATFQKDL